MNCLIFGIILISAVVFCPVFADLVDVRTDANVGAASARLSGKVWIADIEVAFDGLPDDIVIADGVIPRTPAEYDVDVVKRTVGAVSRCLSEKGYPYSKATASVIYDDSDPSIISLRLRVDVDERVCNGPAIIAGVSGRKDIYMKDVRIVPGRLYGTADVDETVRRLSMRSYVREASAGSPVIIENALCDDGRMRMVVTPIMITENRGVAIDGALGYQSGRSGDGGTMNGRVELSFINMLRYGEVIDATYAGTSVSQKLALSGAKPWAFGLPLEIGGALSLEIEDGDGGYGFISGNVWGAVEIDARYRGGAAATASETVPSCDDSDCSEPYQFYGVNVFMSLIAKPWERGSTVWEFEAETGSGVARREKSYNRNKAELTLGVHKALSASTPFAIAGRIRGMAMFTDEEHLSAAEMYRVGGYGSLRGYSETEFAFRSVAYSQIEALYYFNRYGSLYLFTDVGGGFDSPGQISLSSTVWMLGYGAGTRFPSRLGTVSLEWARNLDDGWSLGRVHVGIRRYM